MKTNITNKYRFNGEHIIELGSDHAALDKAIGWYDDRDCSVEKLIGGVWHYRDYLLDVWVSPARPVERAICKAYATSLWAILHNDGKECFVIELRHDGKIINASDVHHAILPAYTMEEQAIAAADAWLAAYPWNGVFGPEK